MRLHSRFKRPIWLTLSVRGASLYVRICRRQILTYKDAPRTERIKIFLNGRGPITQVFK